MKRELFYISLLMLTISCDREKSCAGENENRGDVVSTYEGYNCPDLLFSDHFEKQFVLRSQEDVTAYELDSCLTTTIDFESYSVLGYPQGASGCSQKFIRDVSIDESAKSVHYTVTVKECGGCLPYTVSPNFVFIPKIPDDYEVTFESKRK